MDIVNQELYWKNAATNHVAIQHTETAKHFCTYTMQDVINGLRNMLYPAICMEPPEERLSDGGSDNIRARNSGAILILKKVSTANHTDIANALKETYVIGSDFQAKMLNDRKKALQTGAVAPEKYMTHLDINSVQLVSVGPVLDGCYGYRLEYEFNGHKNIQLDEAKWLPGTETKFDYRTL